MRIGWLAFLLFGLVASPASADVTARYGSTNMPLLTMTVAANDRGDSRLSMGDGIAVLRRGEATYYVMTDASGRFAALQEDWAAVTLSAIPESLRGETPAHMFRYTAEEAGPQTVAGRRGTLWRMLREDGTPSGFEFVICDDADLTPIGRALFRQFSESGSMLTAAFGGMREFTALTDSILSRGTLIKLGRVFQLETVDTHPIDPAEFELPQTVLTRDELAERLGRPAS